MEKVKKESSNHLNDYKLIKIIGKGSYGEVYLVRKISDGTLYALKIINSFLLQKEKKEYHVFVEKDMLVYLRNPYIIKLERCFRDSVGLCVNYI